jgi:hypothetical protein
MTRGAGSVRIGRPDRGDRKATEPVTEAELLGTAVEHESGPEPLAQATFEDSQPPEVFAAYGLGRLDLYADDLAGIALDHGVDLVPVPIAIVVEAGPDVTPGQLAGELRQDKALRQTTDGRSRCGIVGKVVSKTGVDEYDLASSDRAGSRAR